MAFDLEQEVDELIEQFESVISTAKIRVSQCEWYVTNKPSHINTEYLSAAKKQLLVLENTLTDLQYDWNKDCANSWSKIEKENEKETD